MNNVDILVADFDRRAEAEARARLARRDNARERRLVDDVVRRRARHSGRPYRYSPRD